MQCVSQSTCQVLEVANFHESPRLSNIHLLFVITGMKVRSDLRRSTVERVAADAVLMSHNAHVILIVIMQSQNKFS